MTREEYQTLCWSIAPCWYGEYKNLPHQWWMQQQPEEFGDLLEIVSQCNPKVVLEIGSAHGGCLPFFDHIVGEGGLVIGTEPQLDRGFSVVKAPYSTYQPRSNLLLIQDCSYEKSVYDQVVKTIKPYGGIDFLFIDGDHNYKHDLVTPDGRQLQSGTKIDYEMYKPLVKKDGYIGFHDIALEPGCTRAWQEACKDGQNIPITIRYQGIGLVRV